MLIAYSAAIFFALVLGGLLALQGLPSVIARALTFVVLCYACMRVTFWLGARWALNPVELGAAWAIVLLLVAAIEAFRVLRKRQSAT
jgi:hypothetical protein